MSSRKILSRFFSSSALFMNSGASRATSRCLGTAACAKLKGSQHALTAAKITYDATASRSARPYSTEPENLDLAAMDYYEFKDNIGMKFNLVVDVREPQELKEDGRIIGAVNIPLGQVEAVLSKGYKKLEKEYHLSATVEDGSNIIFLCKAGVRAAKAVAIARKLGYERARFYKGSFLEWKERGEPILKGP